MTRSSAFHARSRFNAATLAAATVAAALTFCAPAGRAATPVPPAGVPMAAHHAVYKLSLLKAKGANAPASAVGLIDYNFTGSACDGYTTTFRQVTELQPAEGDARVNDLRSTTFEDGGAREFNFKSTTRNDDDLVSDLDGRARKMSDGRASVELKKPSGRAVLGGGVLFPTEHLRRIIAAAEAGAKILEAEIYDGSDTGKKVFHTLSVIGRPIDTPSPDLAGRAEALKTMRRWPVAISYFAADKENEPDYVLSFDLYENGISRALKLDYGDFVLAGELTDLSMKAAASCR